MQETPIPANPDHSPHIRPLRVRDVPSLLHFKKAIECEAAHLALGNGERTETVIHALARMFVNRTRTRTLVAVHNGQVVGHVTVIRARFKKLRRNAYLTIAVAAAYRGTGLGSRMMHAAETDALSRGARRMELEVFAKNTRAIALYERLGYAEEGRKRGAVDDGDGFDDIVFMAKPLGQA